MVHPQIPGLVGANSYPVDRSVNSKLKHKPVIINQQYVAIIHIYKALKKSLNIYINFIELVELLH